MLHFQMGHSKVYRNKICLIQFLVAITSILIHQITCTSISWVHWCPNTTMFANNSAYDTNLNSLFRSLTTNATNNPFGYYRATVNNPTSEPIFGHYLCFGDQNTSSCHDCVTNAIIVGFQKTYCPNRKIAIIWYDECMVRYSNASFFDQMDLTLARVLDNGNPIIGNATEYMEARDSMMSNVSTRAAEGGTIKKFATAFLNYSIFMPIYGMGQCTPDITLSECYICLNSTIEHFTPNPGCRVLTPSCFLRYESAPFFNLSYLPATSPASDLNPDNMPPGQRGKKGISTKVVVSIVAVSLVVLGVIFSLCIWLLKYNSKKIEIGNGDQDFTGESLQHDLATLVTATNNFSDENRLGEGGFGVVYKGMLPNGQLIAVKRLSASSSQGMQEFKTEVLVVANLQHRNLVRLLGYCYAGKEKLLVYEYVANKSLDNFLFDDNNRRELNWQMRYNIIRGIARGLLYLHHDSQLRIIHRDLKASNVLLDEQMNPKISDFGTSRIFGVDHTQSVYTNRIVGTYGYMAPEYALQGQFSIKSDAYSFGVLILEIISGRKNSATFNQPTGGEDLLSHAWRQWEARTPLEFVDPIIRDLSLNTSEVIRCIHIGLLCTQELTEDRPTMAKVVLTLDSNTVSLPVPQRTASFARASVASTIRNEVDSDHSSSKSTLLSVNDVTFTEVEPR